MILVTGASGGLASMVVAKARALNMGVVTASRSADANRQMDFDDIASLDFSGISTVFLTSAGYAEDDVVMRRHRQVIEAAVDQGVKHLVYTSLSSGSDHLGFALAHRWTEQALRHSGLTWTVLRNGLYAELIGGLCQPQNGTITTPLGYEGISAIAREDLADAAVAVLSNLGEHRNAVYELSGDKPFSAQTLADELGARYEPSSLSQHRAKLGSLELLPFQGPMMMSICSAAMAGFLQTPSTDINRLISTTRDALAVACVVAKS